MTVIPRPGPGEFAPTSAGTIDLVPEGGLPDLLESQPKRLETLLTGLPEARGGFRYAPGKWSLKDLLLHITDTERIMAYRLLHIARGDQTALAGFDQDEYVRTGHADARSLGDLVVEFSAVRQATLALVQSLDAEAWTRMGTSRDKPVSAAAVAHILAGHAAHHLAILEERYIR